MSQPFNRILLLDFETRYATKPQDWCPLGDDLQRTAYTLSKMTNEEYVRAKCFKAFGVSMRWFAKDAPITQWYSHAELERVFSTIDWSTTGVVAHNAQFDISVLSWRYGIQPAFIFDTLSMARALRGVKGKNSLAAIAEDFGLPAKGGAIALSDGVQDLEDVPGLERKLAEYCNHDVALLEEVFKRFLLMCATGHDVELAGLNGTEWDFDDAYDQRKWTFPKKELRLIDMTLRMYTRPLLELDRDMLTDALEEEREAREGLLSRMGVTDGDLASNDRFAEILRSLGVEPPTKKKRPTAKTPNPVGFNYAFAKNDAMFQALLNGDDENVAMLCEARLKVKSTTERTRAQRFLDISVRGPLPVPLSYFGAGTGRWTAAKGSAINMQNLKRGSFLRKAIMAPKGYKIAVGDLSQIEPRVLAWLADYDELLDIFRAKKDAYAMFGSQMFNIDGLTKETHPDLRQSAKSAMLGCFGSQTPVLTKRGWVSIVDVSTTDLLWDGQEWVTHQGLIPQGEKQVLTAHGISATSDHEILTERGWVEWCEVLKNPGLFRSALSLANLPACDGTGATNIKNTVGTLNSPGCAAAVGGRATSTAPTYGTAALHGVIRALKKKLTQRASSSAGWQLYAPTLSTATGCSTASVPSLFGVQTRTAVLTQTTVGVVSRFIRRGSQIVASFFGTLSGLTAGTNLNCNSTAQTTTGVTSPEISASLRAASTWPTSDASPCARSSSYASELQPLKQRMQTYDIAYAGPRNRFTVLTDAGPLIVHNCGYQLGWASFAGQLLVGFLGAPPVRYDKAFAKKLGVDKTYIERFLDWDENVKKMMEIPHTCTTQELLIHCVASKRIIDIYRATAAPVVGLWELFQQLIPRSLADGEEYVHKCLIFRKEEIVLPNGMSMKYPNLRQQKNPDTKKMEWVYGEDATKLYAGKIANNVTQGTARIVMTDGMLRTAARFPVLGTVHDEQLDLVPEQDAEESLAWVLEQMTVEPKYMPGIPLAADGGVHRRYGLAKN